MNSLRPVLLVVALALVACEEDTKIIREAAPPTPATDPTVFAFRTDAMDAYTKVDRMGGPATTTALLMPGAAGGARRQQANLTEPSDDAQYANEYIATLRTLHYELGPALAGLGLAACGDPAAAVAADPDDVALTNVSKCLQIAAPLVIPDVLQLDTRQPSNYPNGRDPDDRVVDVLLAIALLNLVDVGATCFGGACTNQTLAGLPLNPGASNPTPLTAFPYLNNVALAPPPPADP